jgi:hypothetical protein
LGNTALSKKHDITPMIDSTLLEGLDSQIASRARQFELNQQKQCENHNLMPT